jgi:hypothetical protein
VDTRKVDGEVVDRSHTQVYGLLHGQDEFMDDGEMFSLLGDLQGVELIGKRQKCGGRPGKGGVRECLEDLALCVFVELLVTQRYYDRTKVALVVLAHHLFIGWCVALLDEPAIHSSCAQILYRR